jgi:light-regulated signal transduction histidine kinase (bacteriophytochrome)
MTMLDLEAERLSARVEELKREKAALEQFAAVAAHELVEPLVITEAYATMVHDRLDNVEHAESRRDLAALSRTASRARLLIEALLFDARATDEEIFSLEVDLGAVVDGCLEALSSEIAAREAVIEVGELPVVPGNESLLRGLFANLLMNGLKYSRRQLPDISIEADREGEFWRFSVTSQGPTIPVEDRERIFEPYQRGRGERRARGTGLGLAICRRIVERHGGKIAVDPAPGGGNRFHFTLPA